MFNTMRQFIAILLFVIFYVVNAPAQVANSSTDQSTPSALEKGVSPLGTYGGSSFDKVNLFNGNLNFTIPLASLGGRAGLGAGIVLSYNSKIWRVEQQYADGCYNVPVLDGIYTSGPQLAPGWTINVGSMVGRQTSWLDNSSGTTKAFALTTFTFIAPDGTEYDFRDDSTNGAPLQVIQNYAGQPLLDGQPRGITFHTANGTAATFIRKNSAGGDVTTDLETIDKFNKDNPLPPIYPSGIVILRDGTRFTIIKGKVVKQQDRNGNIVRFIYDGSQIKQIIDTLGRTITISYATNQFSGEIAIITFNGVGGVQRTIKIKGKRLDTGNETLVSGEPANYATLFPNLTLPSCDKKVPDYKFRPYVLTEILLPDNSPGNENGHKWKFLYNQHGEIARVETPSGGAIGYTYDQSILPIGDNRDRPEIFRRVKERMTYPSKTDTDPAGMTTYSDPAVTDSNGNTIVFERQRDYVVSAGDVRLVTRHTFALSPIENFGGAFEDDLLKKAGYRPWMEGKELETAQLDNGDVKRLITYTYEQREAVDWITNNKDFERQPENDPRLVKVETTLLDGSTPLTSKVVTQYDKYNNITEEIVYDFDNKILKKTKRTYHKEQTFLIDNQTTTINYQTDLDIHQRSLVESEQLIKVVEVQGTVQEIVEAQTEYEYDKYSGLFHAQLIDRTVGVLTSRNQLAYNSSNPVRGNVTAITSGVGSDPNPKSYMQYDVTGNIVKMIGPGATTSQDEVLYSTDITYDSTHFTFPLMSQKHVLSQVNVGTILNLITSQTYDFSTGAVLSSTGVNQEVTAYSYEDLLGRLTKVQRPTGLGETNYIYSSPTTFPSFITIKTKLNSGNDLISVIESDGLLRTTSKKQVNTDNTGGIINSELNTFYDGLGRPYKITNPHRSTNNSNTDGRTETTYDDLGRVVAITTYNSSSVSTGTVETSYSSATIRVKDQVGKERQSTTDALGRIIEVVEPGESGSVQSNPDATHITEYSYDARGNLVQVKQHYDEMDNNNQTQTGDQLRTFVYDSLGRLLSATAPESGTTTYSYDLASNLKTLTSNPSASLTIVTSYNYDSLNRIVSKNYSDSTPGVDYYYDEVGAVPQTVFPTTQGFFQAETSLGRLLAVVTDEVNPTATVYSYDKGGRVIRSNQFLDGTHYESSTNYNEASLPTQSTYPSGSVVNANYNEFGQVASIQRGSDIIANNLFYTPHGALSQQQLGNGLIHTIEYNSRLQPTTIALGSDSGSGGGSFLKQQVGRKQNNLNGPSDLLRIDYDYGYLAPNSGPGAQLDQTKNNGNIGRILITPGNNSSPIEQLFEYDELNRLSLAREFYIPTTTVPIPEISLISPSSSPQGQTFTLSLSGTNLANTSSIDFLPAEGITVSNISSTDTSVTATISVSSTAGIGNRLVNVTTPLGTSNNVSFIVTPPWIIRTNTNPSLALQGTTVALSIEGFSLANTTDIVFNPPAGLIVSNISSTNTDVTATLTITSMAVPGNHSMKVITQAGESQEVQFSIEENCQITNSLTEVTGAFTTNSIGQPVFDGVSNLNASGTATFDVDMTDPSVIGKQIALRTWWRCGIAGDIFTTPLPASGFIKFETFLNENLIFTRQLNISGEELNGQLNITSVTITDENGQVLRQINPPYFNIFMGGIIENEPGGDGLPSATVTGGGHATIKVKITTQNVGNTGDQFGTFGFCQSSFAPIAQEQQAISSKPGKANGNSSRIKAIQEPNPLTEPVLTWSQNFEYDRFGNRKCCGPEYEGVTATSIAINPANNRISQAGFEYDAAGNLITDDSGKQYNYDGENRMISVLIPGSPMATYTYDGNGKRVKKDDGTTVTRFIYNSSGSLIAEYEGNPSTLKKEYIYGPSGLLAVVENNQSGVEYRYMTPDHLGSARVITDGAGEVFSRRDYFPFGEEIFGIGGRSVSLKYAAIDDTIRKKFTGYERDNETGLDFAQARYYAPTLGRFTSVDPFGGSQKLANPQTWNRYHYCLNNPINATDPFGLEPEGENEKYKNSIVYQAAATVTVAGAMLAVPAEATAAGTLALPAEATIANFLGISISNPLTALPAITFLGIVADVNSDRKAAETGMDYPGVAFPPVVADTLTNFFTNLFNSGTDPNNSNADAVKDAENNTSTSSEAAENSKAAPQLGETGKDMTIAGAIEQKTGLSISAKRGNKTRKEQKRMAEEGIDYDESKEPPLIDESGKTDQNLRNLTRGGNRSGQDIIDNYDPD